MYTVIRFVADPGEEHVLFDLGAQLNKVTPNLFNRLDRVAGRFSLPIIESDDWGEHQRSIAAFVTKYTNCISDLQSRGIHIEVDTAIGPEDYGDMVYFTWGIEPWLLSRITEFNIVICFTVYFCDDSETDDDD